MMKLRNFLTICLAGASLSLFAQTHVEGVEYFQADQIENARDLLNRNLNNPGTDKAVAYYYLGRIAQENGKPSEAAKYFELGAQANPKYAYNYIGLGQLSLANGDFQVAKKNFKEAEGCDKKDPGIPVEIARAYYSIDPVTYEKDIEKYLTTARKKNAESIEVYIFEGDRFADKKDWGRAGSQYEMAVNTDPSATGAYVKYANLFKQVNPQYSINMLKKLLAANPSSALGQRELANAYYDTNNYKQAAEEYGKYVKNPNHFKEDEDRYAFLLFYDGRFQDGYDYATSLLNSNPDNFTARRFQFMNAVNTPGFTEEKLLPLAETLYSAHKANKDKNRFAPIDYNLLGDIFKKAGRTEDAVAVMEEAIAEYPTNLNFYPVLANIWLNANEYGKAADVYTTYVSKQSSPSYSDLYQLALYSYGGLASAEAGSADASKYKEMALSNATKAAASDPTHYRPYKLMGDVEKVSASKEDAASAAAPNYIKAIEILTANPKDDKTSLKDAENMYSYLGYYYYNNGDKAKAKECFTKYLELNPENEAIKKFAATL